MNELVFLKNDEAMTDSLSVAEHFNKNHKYVLQKIEKFISEDSAKKFAQCVRKSTYKDDSGKSNPMYLLNKDGFSFLVMSFTGEKAREWQWKYIEAFNKMESVIREKSTSTWIETRKAGQLTRKAETDTIKRLVEYAKEQGSEHADKLYMTYSRLANKMADIQKRDQATTQQLNNLSLMENIILHEIDNGILAGKHYKAIYKDCKTRLELMRNVAYLAAG